MLNMLVNMLVNFLPSKLEGAVLVKLLGLRLDRVVKGC
jgi:hypothetical protein